MAFNVSYIFQARDQFSGVAKKVKNSVAGVTKKSVVLSRKLNDVGRRFTTNFKTKAAAAISVAKRKMDSLVRSTRNAGKKIKEFGKSFSIGVSASAGVATAVAIRNFNKQEQAMAKVRQGLISTQGVVQLTFDQLTKEATRLQRKTLFGDEEILGQATQTLLTFTNIVGSEFLKAQEATLDLAARMGTDLQSAALQLGKALNDPVANLGALSRAGIQFSEQQKNVIKRLAQSGRLAKAQGIILKELNSQFGGTAEAIAKVGTGPLVQLSNVIGDVAESVGKEQFSILRPLIEGAKNLAEKFEGLSPIFKKVAAVVLLLATVLGPLLILIGSIALLAPFVATGLAAIGTALGAVGGALALLFSPIGLVIAAVVALGFIIFKNFDAIKSAISSAIEFVVEKFNSLVDAFKGSDIGATIINAGAAIIDMWASVFRFFGAIFSAIQVLASTAWESISAGASVAFGSVMDTFLKPLMSAFQTVAGFFADIFSPVVDFLDSVLSSVVGKIDSVIGSVGKVAGFIGGIFDSATEKVREFAGVKIEVKTPSVSLPPVPAFDLAGKRAQAEGFFKAQNQSALKTVAANEALTSQVSARADVNVNLNAPEGLVQSIKTRRTGNAGAMNLGVNMAAGG